MKRLSIIVPVFNVENYLRICLDSLIAQDIDIEEFEIIIINDGSTDGSLIIAQEYRDMYSNIRLISQDNKGLGAARNVGIEEAIGNCIFFVDSDDYIQPNTLGTMLTVFEREKLQLLRFNYEAVNDSGDIIKKKKNATHNLKYSEQVVGGDTFLSEYLGWACYVWSFLYDISYIKNNHFLFNENIFFEDVEWLVRVLLRAHRVQSINKIVYFYLQRSGSITQSIQSKKKNKIIDDKIFIIDILRHLEFENNNLKVKGWCNGLISLTVMSLLAYVENELPERKNEFIKFLYSQNLLPLRSYNFTIKQHRDMFLINLSPKLFCFLKRKN